MHLHLGEFLNSFPLFSILQQFNHSIFHSKQTKNHQLFLIWYIASIIKSTKITISLKSSSNIYISPHCWFSIYQPHIFSKFQVPPMNTSDEYSKRKVVKAENAIFEKTEKCLFFYCVHIVKLCYIMLIQMTEGMFVQKSRYPSIQFFVFILSMSRLSNSGNGPNIYTFSIGNTINCAISYVKDPFQLELSRFTGQALSSANMNLSLKLITANCQLLITP